MAVVEEQFYVLLYKLIEGDKKGIIGSCRARENITSWSEKWDTGFEKGIYCFINHANASNSNFYCF